MYCKKCGSLILDGFSVCLNCGAEVTENFPENKYKIKAEKDLANARRKKRRKLIIGAILFLSVLIVITVSSFRYYSNINFEYYLKMEDVTYKIFDGCSYTETALSQFDQVWRNSISQKQDPKTDKYTMKNGVFFDDFNDALYNLYADPNFLELCNNIVSNQYEIIYLMKDLKNPPKKYEDAYAVLNKLYDSYINFSNSAVKPTVGEDYETFFERTSTYQNSWYSLYQQMLMYFE